MKQLLLLVMCILLATNGNAKSVKKNFKTVEITYESSSNSQRNGQAQTTLQISNNWAKITTQILNPDLPQSLQTIYLDYNDNKEIKVAKLRGGKEIYTTRNFTLNQGLEFLDGTETIAGYTCKKAKTVINSNTLEIWYTTELGVYGSMQPGVAIPDGVVLKVVRNGNTSETAVKVSLLKNELDLKPTLTGQELKAAAYNYRIQQNDVVSIRVFDHEGVYFRDIPKVTEANDTEVMRFANGSIILRKVKLPDDNSGYNIFAELSQYSEGDAYDRTGSVFIIPQDRKKSFMDGLLKGKEALPQYIDKDGNKYEGMTLTKDYLPPLELMRFYTSFGVKGYNHIQVNEYNWPDSIVYKQEVTDYAKDLKGQVWVGAWIGNYAQNGHNVTLDIKYYPNWEKRETPKEVLPLFTTTNIMEMAGQAYPENMFRNDSLTVDFTTDTDLKNAYIRYTSTGHGGWGGGDEFNPKLNEIFLDGRGLMAYTPWREDCGSYRNSNPASGNFSNGLSSSDLSRSGWCPGLVSYPVIVHIGDLKAGTHQVKVAIPVGNPEGNSHSYWCISGVLIGDKN